MKKKFISKQLEDFIVKRKKELVWKLNKSLYGLNQSPKMWYQKFNMYIQELGFVRSRVDHYVYNKKFSDHFIYLLLYVDDMLLVKNNMDLSKEVRSHLSYKFNMKDLIASHFILRMEIKRY